MAVTVNIYNIDQLNLVLDKINTAFIKYSNGIYNFYSFGLNCKDNCLFYKLYLAKRITEEWISNFGSDYTSITEEQFTDILVDALNYCN